MVNVFKKHGLRCAVCGVRENASSLNTEHRTPNTWLSFTLACLFSLIALIPARADRLLADAEALLQYPHRLAGTPELKAAADHVEARLRAIGLDEVLVQEFPLAQNRTLQCEIILPGGSRLPLIPARPNGIIPPVTPPEGLTGEVVDVGDGSDDRLNLQPIRDRIVVMDYNAGMQWLKAFRLGAKAVIFVENGTADAKHHHYARANGNLPRFYYKGPRDDLAHVGSITIHSRIAWERGVGRNVIGYLKGTDPTFELGREELIILAAPLDSFGEFPALSPGARNAVNCAGLLQLAESMVENRPRRNILFLFLDNQARAHGGAVAFYWALEQRVTEAATRARLQSTRDETAFLSQMLELIRQPDPLRTQSGELGRQMLRRLRDKARDESLEQRGALVQLREARDLGRKDDALDDERHEQLSQAIDNTKREFDEWNEVRRALNRLNRQSFEELARRKEKVDAVIAAVTREISARIDELAHEEHMLETSARLAELAADQWIALHVSLILGDATPRWGVMIGGDSESRSVNFDQPGLYGRVQQSFLRAHTTLARSRQPIKNFELASVDGSLSQPRLLWAAPALVHGGEIAGRFGIYNIVLGTMHETLSREGTPSDTLDQLNLALIGDKLDEITRMLTAVGSQAGEIGAVDAVADQRGLSLRRVIATDYQYINPRFRGSESVGALVMGRHRGSSIPNQRMPNVVIQVTRNAPWNKSFWPYNNPVKAPGFDQFDVVMSDQNGAYAIGALPRDDSSPSPVGFAALFDDNGHVLQVSDQRSRESIKTRMNLIRVRGAAMMIPPRMWPEETVFLDARGNGRLTSPRSERAYTETTDGLAVVYAEEKVNAIKMFAINSAIGLNNAGMTGEITWRDSLGVGLPISDNWLTIPSASLGAWDLWRLNESRLGLLRAKDILNSSLEELHGRVRDLLDEADATEAPVRSEALAASGLLASTPIYEMIRAAMDDLVTAVLVLLALCIPFAFALERLLIGSSLIYKQVAWFVGFFIATFILLYLSHPAFAIAQTPIIIFLGFAVVSLSGLVIFIIMQKFEVELKAIQGMTSTVHASDISRFNTVMAAMSMGISTMRRRPLRTALTAITICLLTFTILGFASFDTQRGIIRFFSSPTPGYTGVLLHQPNWGTYNPEFVEIVRGRWEKDASIAVRYWLCPEFQGDPDFVAAHADGSHPVTIKGMLGIPENELTYRADFMNLLGIDDPSLIHTHVFMTEAVAELLKVKPGDPVIVKGQRLTVGPLVNASAFGAMRDMDASSIIPVDYAQMQGTQAATEQSPEDMLTDQGTWANLPTDSVVITSDLNTLRAGGKPTVVTFYTADAQQASIIAEDLARMLDRRPILATRIDGVYRHIQGTVVAASGVSDLFFPILLGGLVIFGTMLGSVADREKEIYTFSALGLAPPHVASLFFAEAMVYSVIGGMGGYLIAQGTMKVLTFLASFGLLQVPEMNYSSTNAIVTILIVMATVLVSAIFPAIKASKSANPGLLRSWRAPAPEGDEYDIVFPFTVSEYDLTGVISFLREHFNNFSDTGLGAFMAKNPELVKFDDGNLGLRAHLALAPFDLGVTQHFELRSAPSEIKGIDEVKIKLIRKSGQPKDWVRLNKQLFDDLRTQFLLWRSLPRETMENYRQETLVAMGKTRQAGNLKHAHQGPAA
ncbi:MAG TPA: hypothetical protein PKE26_05620 [Kiritimatiellia bacterium]|nr:hypothetical protein [Kiritimatiellia bacterium]HMO98571.1 hypothetical protein [Kiritimatiellia bacterium]HMP95450.1 hypothetical protein [Kiritimatiellia bacterium]